LGGGGCVWWGVIWGELCVQPAGCEWSLESFCFKGMVVRKHSQVWDQIVTQVAGVEVSV
jgi:hypothetical protein